MPEDKSQNPDKVILNGREITAEELERQKESAKNQKGARLTEISEGKFQLRLNG
jgi:hypothetical protein